MYIYIYTYGGTVYLSIKCSMYVYILYILNPLKSELLTKQACRDKLVVYSLFFSPTTYNNIY